MPDYRKIGLRRTVLANCKIAECSPDHNIARFFSERIASPDYLESQKACADLIAALSAGYEYAAHFEDPGHVPVPVTADEVLCLSEKDFNALFQKSLDVFQNDGQQMIELAPPEGKKTAKKATSSKASN